MRREMVRFTLYVSSTILIIELGQWTRSLLNPKMGCPHCQPIPLLRKTTTLRRKKIKKETEAVNDDEDSTEEDQAINTLMSTKGTGKS
jgi:hypothetical protein